MPDLRPLTAYLFDLVNDNGGAVGMTALIKLVYILDVEYYRRYSTLATGLKWWFHHYGPWVKELEDAILNNPYITVSGGTVSRPGYRFNLDSSWKEIRGKFLSEYGRPVEIIANSVVADWGLEPLEAILDYVYFETEPMQDARRGSILDFSTITRGVIETSNDQVRINIPEETSIRLRQRMEQRRLERNQSPSHPMTPPVYGDDYYAALRVMYQEEHPRYPDLKPGTRVHGPVQE